jgi:hypothetical protein
VRRIFLERGSLHEVRPLSEAEVRESKERCCSVRYTNVRGTELRHEQCVLRKAHLQLFGKISGHRNFARAHGDAMRVAVKRG